MFHITAEFIVAGQFLTTIDLLFTIIIISVFYKHPSAPIPRWLKYTTFELIKPMAFIEETYKFTIVFPEENETKIKTDGDETHNGDKKQQNEQNKEKSNKINKIQQDDTKFNENEKQWQMVAKIWDRFLFIVNLSAVSISFLTLIIIYMT